jgi:hypothetical protein
MDNKFGYAIIHIPIWKYVPKTRANMIRINSCGNLYMSFG